MSVMTDWIRPWYPVGPGVEDHLYPDCENLLQLVSEPREGSGWLDPRRGEVCRDCLHRYDPALHKEIFEPPMWDAECSTCDASMQEKRYGDGPFDESDAKAWDLDHRCEPSVRIIPPTSKKDLAA